VAHTSEIDKLERRYAENPEGRNFAPLADAYRKAGQVDQAVELCRSGLERHPDYVSAHIVLGRCYLDKKGDGEAEQIFRKVLELDPENVIAFKVLADIAARGGRFDEAVSWLTRLLAADPMHSDAAEALAVAKRKAAQAPRVAEPPKPPKPPPPPPSTEPLFRAVPEAAPLDVSELVVEHVSVRVAAVPPTPEPAAADSGIEVYDGTLNFGAVAAEAPKTEGIQLEEEVTIQPAPVEVEGLARTQYEGSGVFKVDVPPPHSAPPLPPPPAAEARPEPEPEDLPTIDLPLILPDDTTPPVSRRTPEFTSPVPPPPPPPPLPVPQAAAPPRRTSAPVAAAVALSDDDGAADTAALSRAEPVLTETMAELYLRQGHEEDARRVYEALLKQRPGDDRLRAKVQQVFGGGAKPASSGETVRSFLKGILTRRPGAEAPGSPLDSAFGQAPSEGAVRGEPTHKAGDNISLDEVFGMEGSGSTTAPAPVASAPVVGAGAGPTEAANSGGTGGFSFDEFFAAKGAPDTNAAPQGAKAPSRPSDARPKPQGEEHADLDQFQAWLKGLKS
jgi:tetratricopeptide (TPR) repeat protein